MGIFFSFSSAAHTGGTVARPDHGWVSLDARGAPASRRKVASTGSIQGVVFHVNAKRCLWCSAPPWNHGKRQPWSHIPSPRTDQIKAHGHSHFCRTMFAVRIFLMPYCFTLLLYRNKCEKRCLCPQHVGRRIKHTSSNATHTVTHTKQHKHLFSQTEDTSSQAIHVFNGRQIMPSQ